MLLEINPKLPMRNKSITLDFYTTKLGFSVFGNINYEGYLMLQKEAIQIHFFEFRELNPLENYGQVYIRTNDIDQLYNSYLANNVPIHPNGKLETKPWGQKEFAILDPDHNLITFGEAV
jgi:catechol 2,3-dioxygenase-like lactoylglutathione lyase family enzyme